MVFLCSRLKAGCRNTYHLDTKTCFSLFESFDFFGSGWLSCNGAFLFKGELVVFKTPSTCDVLNFESVTVHCSSVSGNDHFRHHFCGAHRSRSRGISLLPCPYFNSALRASFGKLRFWKKSPCPPGNVLGDRARMVCG